MADNYLEKKYEELRHGKPVIRRNTPSLDTLLRKVGEDADIDTGYLVKQAQLDAIVRSAGFLGGLFVFETCEAAADSSASVRITCQGSSFLLGQIVMAVRLKAAELGLDSAVEPEPSCPDAASPLCITVSVFRNHPRPAKRV